MISTATVVSISRSVNPRDRMESPREVGDIIALFKVAGGQTAGGAEDLVRASRPQDVGAGGFGGFLRAYFSIRRAGFRIAGVEVTEQWRQQLVVHNDGRVDF